MDSGYARVQDLLPPVDPTDSIGVNVRITKFLSSPFTIRVPFFLIFRFNKGALKQKRPRGATQEPR